MELASISDNQLGDDHSGNDVIVDEEDMSNWLTFDKGYNFVVPSNFSSRSHSLLQHIWLYVRCPIHCVFLFQNKGVYENGGNAPKLYHLITKESWRREAKKKSWESLIKLERKQNKKKSIMRWILTQTDGKLENK